MAPLKKHPENCSSSKNHQKKTKRRRSSNKLSLIYKYLGNLCDLNSEKPEKNSKRIIIHKKGCKHEHDDDSKYANSEKSYRDFDSCEASTDEEFEDVSESSADTSKEDTKSEIRAKTYVRKALDLGLKNGYLLPADASCRVLRVSSNLVELENRKRKHERSSSNDTRASTQGENDEIAEKRRRQKHSKGRKEKTTKTRRPRSHARRRLAQYCSRNEESEDMAEEHDDENSQEELDEEEDQENKSNKDDETNENVKNSRSNAHNRDVKEEKKEENSDDEGSDEEQEKKG